MSGGYKAIAVVTAQFVKLRPERLTGVGGKPVSGRSPSKSYSPGTTGSPVCFSIFLRIFLQRFTSSKFSTFP